jgi:hypothetical protein
MLLYVGLQIRVAYLSVVLKVWSASAHRFLGPTSKISSSIYRVGPKNLHF